MTNIIYGFDTDQGPAKYDYNSLANIPPKISGKDGLSAFEIAQKHGFSGTETEWLNSLKGATGDTGSSGISGKDGLSAFEIAQKHGFSGTETEWLESLNGTNGTNGTNGIDGLSAFEIAQKHGFSGAETEWLESLNGANGIDGKSAYDIAVKNGFSGTETEWLESLHGKSATDEVEMPSAEGLYVLQAKMDNGILKFSFIKIKDLDKESV